MIEVEIAINNIQNIYYIRPMLKSLYRVNLASCMTKSVILIENKNPIQIR